MSNTGHRIIITNYKPFEKITYSIVLFKGSITNNNCTIEEQYVIVAEEKCIIGPKNTFKTLLKLKQGANHISFRYCCQIESFCLIYEPLINCKRSVCPLYVIFREHDGSFQAPRGIANDAANGFAKLEVNCQLIQTIIAEKLYEKKLKHHTFHLDSPQFFYSNMSIEESRTLHSQLLFHKIAMEIEKSPFASPNVKHIAFLSGTMYNGDMYREGMTHDELIGITERYISLGCGGLAVFHTACLYIWPNRLEDVLTMFVNDTAIDRRELLDDSNYRGTWGASYSTTLGSVLHELCHAFDLGHSNVGIMSRGFDDVRDIFLVDSADAVEADRRRGMHGITDSTTLHTSGAYILRYNKWFLDENADTPYTLTFDEEHHILRSSCGIRLVEVREGDEQMTTRNWVYWIGRMNVQIDLRDLKEKSMLFVQDAKGNTLKVALNY